MMISFMLRVVSNYILLSIKVSRHFSHADEYLILGFYLLILTAYMLHTFI